MVRQRAVRCFAAVLATAVVSLWALACARGERRAVEPPPTPKPAMAPTTLPTPNLLTRLQGKWVGHPGSDTSQRWEWTIAGETVEAKNSSGDYYRGTMHFDEQAKPVRVDVKLSDSSDPNLKGETVRGIVKLEGNKVSMCFTESSDSYPTTFDESEGLLLIGEKK